MATTNTPILNLTEAIPGSNEPFSTAVVNSNFDAIDAFAGTTNANIGALQTQVNALGDNWVAWTPNLTAVTTNPNLGSGATKVGAYVRIGNTVIFYAQITLGSSGVTQGSGNYHLDLPIAAAVPSGTPVIGNAFFVPSGSSIYGGSSTNGLLNSAGSTLTTLTGTVISASMAILGNSMNIQYSGSYPCTP